MPGRQAIGNLSPADEPALSHADPARRSGSPYQAHRRVSSLREASPHPQSSGTASGSGSGDDQAVNGTWESSQVGLLCFLRFGPNSTGQQSFHLTRVQPASASGVPLALQARQEL